MLATLLVLKTSSFFIALSTANLSFWMRADSSASTPTASSMIGGVDDCVVGLFCAEEVDPVRVSDGPVGDNELISAVLDGSIPVDDGGDRDDVLGRNGHGDGSEGVPRRVDILFFDDESDPS